MRWLFMRGGCSERFHCIQVYFACFANTNGCQLVMALCSCQRSHDLHNLKFNTWHFAATGWLTRAKQA